MFKNFKSVETFLNSAEVKAGEGMAEHTQDLKMVWSVVRISYKVYVIVLSRWISYSCYSTIELFGLRYQNLNNIF